MADRVCAVCNVPAVQCCSGCNTTYYCNRDHQKLHWKNGHKHQCVPFKMQTNETLGRHLVATRNIKEGEIIMRKPPLVLAPKLTTYPICLGCHKRLVVEGEFYSCSKCHWPLCGPECERKEIHKDECKILAKSGYRPSVKNDDTKQSAYACIGPLRALLLKDNCRSKFENVLDMQSHLEENRKSPVYQILKATVVPFIQNILKLDFSADKILTICSIFDTNSFNVRDTTGYVNIRGIYPTVHYIAHNCKHNTKHSFHGEDYQMHVIATTPIAKGEIITTTYTQTLWGTLTRRTHLKQAKHFDCSCKRCSDPSEFGTYAGSIYCVECRKSNKEDSCPKMVSLDPLDHNSVWKCEHCDHTIGARQMVWGNQAIKTEIAQIDKSSPDSFEDFLEKYKDALHSTNYHFLEVKYALSQLYGNINGYLLTELSDDLLERKINLCNELLEIADTLEPGMSKFRGSLLYDLQAAMVVQARKDYEADKITKTAARKILEEAVDILQESTKILQTEPGMKEILQQRLKHLLEVIDF